MVMFGKDGRCRCHLWNIYSLYFNVINRGKRTGKNGRTLQMDPVLHVTFFFLTFRARRSSWMRRPPESRGWTTRRCGSLHPHLGSSAQRCGGSTGIKKGARVQKKKHGFLGSAISDSISFSNLCSVVQTMKQSFERMKFLP